MRTSLRGQDSRRCIPETESDKNVAEKTATQKRGEINRNYGGGGQVKRRSGEKCRAIARSLSS